MTFLKPKLVLDLKQELKIRNISLPQRNTLIEKSTISATSSSKNYSNVSKLNDLNDSKNNNNLSLNASADNNTNSLNNSSSLETTLHNVSGGLNATSSSHKSHNDSFLNKSPQSVLKCTFNYLIYKKSCCLGGQFLFCLF